ncbi:hypothetical protein ACJ41O_006418 [Fusarium nematophilum]
MVYVRGALELEEALLQLHGPRKSIKLCLEHIQTTSLASIFTYGLVADSPAPVDWRTSFKDNWGVRHDPVSNARYIGTLVNDLRHGLGRVLDADGSVHEGSWVGNNREGPGRHTKGAVVLDSGIFINNHLEKAAVMVNVSVYEDEVPVEAASVALICHANLGRQPTVEEIEGVIPAQVARIAETLGWQPGQRHRLRT